jgi:hypothetical protein
LTPQRAASLDAARWYYGAQYACSAFGSTQVELVWLQNLDAHSTPWVQALPSGLRRVHTPPE